VSVLRRATGNKVYVYFWCPGCDTSHMVCVPPHDKAWSFNGDPVKPTFSPSVLVTSSRKKQETRCHSFVTDGMINFLDDCTAHQLRGLHPLPDWPKPDWANVEPFEGFDS